MFTRRIGLYRVFESAAFVLELQPDKVLRPSAYDGDSRRPVAIQMHACLIHKFVSECHVKLDVELTIRSQVDVHITFQRQNINPTNPTGVPHHGSRLPDINKIANIKSGIAQRYFM